MWWGKELGRERNGEEWEESEGEGRGSKEKMKWESRRERGKERNDE